MMSFKRIERRIFYRLTPDKIYVFTTSMMLNSGHRVGFVNGVVWRENRGGCRKALNY